MQLLFCIRVCGRLSATGVTETVHRVLHGVQLSDFEEFCRVAYTLNGRLDLGQLS